MSSRKVLISGASIAGPALALLLGRNGYEVTVVERAPAVRPGGQAVDFKGRTHRRVLERMGVMDAVLAAQTPKTDIRLVDADGRIKAVMPGEFIGGDVEILRDDLASLLHEHAAQQSGFVFDEEIVALNEDAGGVAVSFAHGHDDRFDLVVGADGIHSEVRALAFGPETDHLRRLGYHYVVVNGDMSTDDLVTLLPDGRTVGYGYNEPGRFATLGGPKASQMFVFRADPDVPGYDRGDVRTQKEFLARHFRGAGWRVPAMLDAALAADDFYLDELARTTMTSFTRSRVALVGDSGYANTLGGFGTGLAMVGAYVLAGELVAAGDDHVAAFAAYDQRMRSLTAVARRGSAGPFLAPPSRLRIRLRDLTFANRTLFHTMMRATDLFATDDSVPDYPLN